jgi:choline kinase
MNIIILGDKFQKRMKSRGCEGLIKINNKPILELQYKNIKKVFPEAKVIYVSGFESKKLLSYTQKHIESYADLVVIDNKEYDRYNYTYSLCLAKDYLDSNCLICFGDSMMNKGLFNKFSINNGSQVFIDKKHKSALGCIINDNNIENIAYDLDNYITNIYYLSKRDSMAVKDMSSRTQNYNSFIFEIINKLISSDQHIKPYQIG